MKFLSSIKNSVSELNKPSSIAFCGMLLAIKAVLGFLTVLVAPSVKIGFSFIPVSLGAMLFGGVWAAFIGGLGDILSYILNPVGGAYFPGFTVNGVVMGLIYGFFFYKKNKISIKRIIACELFITVIVELILSSLWLEMMLSSGYFVILTARLLKCIVMFPISVLCDIVLVKLLPEIKKITDKVKK